MPVSMLTEAIEQGVPLVVLSPHLDDAVLSCGALLIYACSRTPVTVVTLFTAANSPPYTLSARRYLDQVGAGRRRGGVPASPHGRPRRAGTDGRQLRPCWADGRAVPTPASHGTAVDVESAGA